ncbi:PAS domain-containing protein [Phenylobacterium terrae]|uniref:PAS domain-containing protein n=1 Tax=Phenylobacterium terrae TaxID=2665495 RepID=A0ABW4MWX1_9CAUL
MSVFHSNTEMLIDYWRSRAFRGAPLRGPIDPADFAPIAPQVFVLGRAGPGSYGFRLVGELVRELFAQDLRGVPALDLWRPRDAGPLRTALEDARRRGAPLVVHAHALTERAALPIEVLFAPLPGDDVRPDRVLGLVQPLTLVARLQGAPVLTLALERMLSAGPAVEPAPHLRLAALNGRRIA